MHKLPKRSMQFADTGEVQSQRKAVFNQREFRENSFLPMEDSTFSPQKKLVKIFEESHRFSLWLILGVDFSSGWGGSWSGCCGNLDNVNDTENQDVFSLSGDTQDKRHRIQGSEGEEEANGDGLVQLVFVHRCATGARGKQRNGFSRRLRFFTNFQTSEKCLKPKCDIVARAINEWVSFFFSRGEETSFSKRLEAEMETFAWSVSFQFYVLKFGKCYLCGNPGHTENLVTFTCKPLQWTNTRDVTVSVHNTWLKKCCSRIFLQWNNFFRTSMEQLVLDLMWMFSIWNPTNKTVLEFWLPRTILPHLRQTIFLPFSKQGRDLQTQVHALKQSFWPSVRCAKPINFCQHKCKILIHWYTVFVDRSTETPSLRPP